MMAVRLLEMRRRLPAVSARSPVSGKRRSGGGNGTAESGRCPCVSRKWSHTDPFGIPNYRTHKHKLFGKQEGLCGGCRVMFPFRNFTVDHIIPQSKGGSGHLENLQLLCGACNSMKGAGSQEEFVARLKAEGLRR